MKIAVQTSLPAFQNDIGDVVRLFYGEGAAVEETQQADARLTHIHEEADGEWRETFVLTDRSGRTEQNTLSAPAVFGGLEEKRQKKRLIKRCCYMLFKRLSGRQPAWGSLTGIRPTRLYYQQLENGKTRGEARQTLQDLFDLSQEKIDLLDEILDAQQGLMDRRARACDVYIGIPFCTTGENFRRRLAAPARQLVERFLSYQSPSCRRNDIEKPVGYGPSHLWIAPSKESARLGDTHQPRMFRFRLREVFSLKDFINSR